MNEREKKKVWRLFALVLFSILVVNVYHAKTKERWWPDLDDGTLKFEYSDWWGFIHRKYYPEWRRESDASPEDIERWCIRHTDGKWHTFIWRACDECPVDIYFPLK